MKSTLLLAAAALASGHLCTLSPLQRGGAAGASKAAADVCIQLQGPCPVPNAGTPAAAYIAGQVATISLMKNENHWTAATPGNFSAFLMVGAKTTFLGSYPDTAAPSLTVYQLPVVIPANTTSGSAVIQTIYYTDNSAAPPAFYQCSDVQIL